MNYTENIKNEMENDDYCNLSFPETLENNDSLLEQRNAEVKQEDSSLSSPSHQFQFDLEYNSLKCTKHINEVTSKKNDDNVSLNMQSISIEIEEFKPESKVVEVKHEIMEGDSLVSYDYPYFSDAKSMDSNESIPSQDKVKCEMFLCGDNNEISACKRLDEAEIKTEVETLVTETHLISNKLINRTSTVTNPHDGIIQSEITNTLVMEILPMDPRDAYGLPKINNPEEILPTCSNNDISNSTEYHNTFQLNSITGNILSLEQEAYSLLKAKHKINLQDKRHICPKCPKAYRYTNSLKKHLSIHDTIERREKGVIKSRQTRLDNRNKKLNLELDNERDLKYEISEVKKPLKLKSKRSKKKEDISTGKLTKKETYLVPDKLVFENVNTHQDEYVCMCGKAFQRRSRMETCLRSHNLIVDTNCSYSCSNCPKIFKNKDELSLHRKRLHNRKKFPCKFCPTDYNTRKELFKHLQIHQKVQLMEYKVISEVVKGKQKLRCFMCAKTCSELSELKSHVMDDHKEPYICPHCKNTFTKIIDFGHHTKKSHPEVEGQSVLDVLEAFSKLVKAWKCEECELQFYEADKLAIHQIEKHSSESKVEPQFQCLDCRRVFITQKGLTSHRRVHHSSDSADATEKEDKGVMCAECRKVCKDMEALTSHMRLHSPDRKYPCKFCDFRFATPEKRKAHAEIHTGDMKFVCFICEYQCTSENRLKLHKKSPRHLQMKEYLLAGQCLVGENSSVLDKKDSIETRQCDINKKVKNVDDENEDNESSSSSDNVETACDVCGDKFSCESDMLEHKQTHPFIEFPNDDNPTRIFFK